MNENIYLLDFNLLFVDHG